MRSSDNGFYDGYDYSLNDKTKGTGFLRFLTIALPVIMVLVFAGGVIMGYLSRAEVINTPLNLNPAPVRSQLSIEENAQLLRVVNSANPLEEDFVPELAAVDSVQVSELMADSLKELLSQAKRENIPLTLESGYISFDSQQKLYEQKKQDLMDQKGYTAIKAESIAKRTVPKGGESEAQTGLLAVFSTCDEKAEGFEASSAFMWLQRNCIKYGFIERFTKQGEKYTAMQENASVFRYVGKENALKMRSYNMCLEQYVRHTAQV